MPEVYSNDVNIWNSLNLSGRREGPFYVDEPDFVLTQEERARPSRMLGKHVTLQYRENVNGLCISDYVSDPFIPQRGRRRSSNELSHSQQQDSAMATHLNGGESADIARHIHQVSSSVEQLPQQQQRLGRDRVDDNANFRRFLRRLLEPADILAIGNANDSTGKDREEDLELQGSPQQTWLASSQPLHAPISSPHNLSPQNPMQLTSPTTIKQPKHHWVSQQRNASRDTFYLARGSHIHQRLIQ